MGKRRKKMSDEVPQQLYKISFCSAFLKLCKMNKELKFYYLFIRDNITGLIYSLALCLIELLKGTYDLFKFLPLYSN